MRLNDLKRLVVEDFEQDDRALVQKLAFALNPFLEQISTIFNKNIDFDNLNRELLTVTVDLDMNGNPKTQTVVKSNLKTRVRGLTCVRAENLTNDGTYPTSAVFVTFSTSGNLITILNVTGIPANKRYSLTLESIG